MAEKEYIERGALIAEYDRVHVGAPGGARKLMVDAPAADVVEVVRCKDCVSCRTLRRNDRFEALYPEDSVYCMREDCGKSKDDFCSWGVRKESDNG